MKRPKAPLKVTALRFVRAVAHFAGSEVGGKARLMFAGLFALLCGLSALNVVNSYVGRNFMTAIAERNSPEFLRQALLYLGVFAALTVVGVIARFAEERLALLWREFITRRAVTLYLADRTYYRLDVSGQLSHPDQRIAEDIRAFTVTTLSFVLMVFNSSLTIIAFSGVLWSINPLLFVLAVLYAACGSYLTFLLGRPLITLNYDQLDKEANFRSGLLHVHEKAEPMMLARSEEPQRVLLLQRLDDLIANFRRITAVNRNVGFFTTGYNWLIQIIPILIVAPAFMRGELEFGVITQSAAAFAMLVGAFSLIVTQFQSISNFAAVVSRLSSLQEAIEKTNPPAASAIEVVQHDRSLGYEGLTLTGSADGNPLVKDLSVSIASGTNVLVTGPIETPGVALFKVTAGITMPGAGRIVQPAGDSVIFLQQRPYLPPGTLRQMLVTPERQGDTSDEHILQALVGLDLDNVVAQAGGLDEEQNWETSLSLTDQQLLVFAKVLTAQPRFVLLDRIETTMGPEQFVKVLRLLSEKSITYINFGKAEHSRELYGAVLEFDGDGAWTWLVDPRHPS